MNVLDYLKYIIDQKHNTHNFINAFLEVFSSFTGTKLHPREGEVIIYQSVCQNCLLYGLLLQNIAG